VAFTAKDDLTAKDRFVLVLVKLERAKNHLKNFETSAEVWRDKYLQVIKTDVDPKTGKETRSFKTPPLASFELLAIAGDVLQNLRSALDHLAFQLVEAGQGRPVGTRRGKRIGFPIFDMAKDYEALKTGKIKGARKSAIKAIDALKPYKRRNGTLWMIHYFNNIDKHRQLITIGHAYLFEGEGFYGPYFRQAARPLFEGIFGPEVNDNSKLVIGKSLGQPKIGKRQPLLPFLREAVKCVEAIVTAFEPHLRPRTRR